jgi:hypothetical protein
MSCPTGDFRNATLGATIEQLSQSSKFLAVSIRFNRHSKSYPLLDTCSTTTVTTPSHHRLNELFNHISLMPDKQNRCSWTLRGATLRIVLRHHLCSKNQADQPEGIMAEIRRRGARRYELRLLFRGSCVHHAVRVRLSGFHQGFYKRARFLEIHRLFVFWNSRKRFE